MIAQFLGFLLAFNASGTAAEPAMEQLREMSAPEAVCCRDIQSKPPSIQAPQPVRRFPAAEINGGNVSQEYKATWKIMTRPWSQEETAELRKYKVLLIPGFMADGILKHGPKFSSAQEELQSFSEQAEMQAFAKMEAFEDMAAKLTFADQMKWLQSLGVEYERLAVNLRHTSKHNAPIVAAAIESSDKPVLIISHSKGGLDFVEAVLENPSLSKKVKGWISIQCPFFGSPVADFIVRKPFIFKWCSKYLILMGGSPDALIGMTTRASRQFYDEKKEAIAHHILASMPVLTFGSWKKRRFLFDIRFWLSRDLMAFHGIRSDGMVPAKSAVLPGTDYISVGGVSHTMTTGNDITHFDRERFSKTILGMLLRRTE